MVVGPGITGPPCQTRGGEAPSGLVGSHKGPEMACALTMPLNRPIFAGSRDAQAPVFVVPAAAEPAVVSMPAAIMPKASSTINFLISPPFLIMQKTKYLSTRTGGSTGNTGRKRSRALPPRREAGAALLPWASVLTPEQASARTSQPAAAARVRHMGLFRRHNKLQRHPGHAETAGPHGRRTAARVRKD